MIREYIYDFTHLLKNLSIQIEGNLICEETIDCGFKQNGFSVKNEDFFSISESFMEGSIV